MPRSVADLILEKILNDDRLKNSNAFRGGVYRDEPIIKKASSMKAYVPDKIREIRKITASPYTLRFYKQAVFMENYEDDYEFNGSFGGYYPTYSDMSNDQLRGYFSWRTKVRGGDIRQTSIGFVFVYIYELLMLIGAKDEADAYSKLTELARGYGAYGNSLDPYMPLLLESFAVYYNLDPSYLKTEEKTRAELLPAMLRPDKADDDELFNSAANLSSYNILRSRLYGKNPEETKQAVCAVLRTYSSYYNAHRKKTFFEHLFGSSAQVPFSPFAQFVFYDRRKYEDYEYTVNECLKYKCENGHWYKQSFCVTQKSKKLGEIIRAVDFYLRQRLNINPQIKEGEISKQTRAIIQKELDRLEEEKRKSTPKVIDLDLSKLSDIRRAADITRDRLMTEEEMDNPPRIIPENPGEENAKAVWENPPEKSPENSVKVENPHRLTADEAELLNILLTGGDPFGFASKKGVMLSVLCEGVNEKLFDEIGDTVLDFEGEKPYIIEDYTDDVKGILKR